MLRRALVLLATPQLVLSGGNYVTMKWYSNTGCVGQATAEAQWEANKCYTFNQYVSPAYPNIYNVASAYGVMVSCDASTVTVNQYYSGTTGTQSNCDNTPIQTATGNTDAAAYCTSFQAFVLGAQVNLGSMSYRCSILPCFSREVSTACLMSDLTAPAQSAYDQCFGDATETTGASRVLMTELRAGDHVLTVDPASGEPVATRIVVNQHIKPSNVVSEVLTVHHADGSIAVTPDHVVSVDGEFASANTIAPGSTLAMPTAEGHLRRVAVEAVTKSTGGIINPLTASGTILAATDGAAVLASAYPDWIASFMLDLNYYPLPYSLSSTISYVLPGITQEFYDAKVEAFFWKNAHWLQDAEKASSSFVKLAIIAAFDVAIAGAFGLYQCVNAPVASVSILAVVFALRARK